MSIYDVSLGLLAALAWALCARSLARFAGGVMCRIVILRAEAYLSTFHFLYPITRNTHLIFFRFLVPFGAALHRAVRLFL